MSATATTIDFKAEVLEIKGRLILRLPIESSRQLSSRSQIAVSGKINDVDFVTVLEPDGYLGHWMNITSDMRTSAAVSAGDTVHVVLQTSKVWPEPVVPKDLAKALAAAPDKVKEKWQDITPMARHEWVRWIAATSYEETRNIRIEKTISKLNGKHRRPCCFNLAACTDMELCKSARLIDVA